MPQPVGWWTLSDWTLPRRLDKRCKWSCVGLSAKSMVQSSLVKHGHSLATVLQFHLASLVARQILYGLQNFKLEHYVVNQPLRLRFSNRLSQTKT